MSRYVELRPFTQLEPEQLGRDLSELAMQNEQAIRRDFPGHILRFVTPEGGKIAVEDEQARMRGKLGYEALAVCLGEDRQRAKLAGFVSYDQTELRQYDDDPEPILSGPMLSIWLDQARPPSLRRIGYEVIDACIGRIAKNPHVFGHAWAMVRPENTASQRVWQHAAYTWGGFEPWYEPSPYPAAMSDDTPYQLFVSQYTIEGIPTTS